MLLPARLARVLDSLGIAAASVPRELAVTGPFGQPTCDEDALARWLGARGAERIERVMALAPVFDPYVTRVRDEALRELARADAAAAERHAMAVPDRCPYEDVLGVGALARMSALAAAGSARAPDAVRAAAAWLAAPRAVARFAAARIAEVALADDAAGEAARAALEQALHAAIEAARELGASGQLAAGSQPLVAELLVPDMHERVAAATGRILDLVSVLGGVAGHAEGLTRRLSALAPQVPAFAARAYVVAYLVAIGSAETGRFLDEVHARLGEAADDAEPEIRVLALEAMSSPARCVPALVEGVREGLLDPDERVRAAAALAAGEIGTVDDAAAQELADMIELDEADGALAAVRALARAGRLEAGKLDELTDPLVRAVADVLAILPHAATQPDVLDAAFEALSNAYAAVDDPGELEAVDPRLQPRALLVEALRALPVERAGHHLARLATDAPGSEVLAEIWFSALAEGGPVPASLEAAGAALVDALAHAEGDRAAALALVAARLVPGDPRLEALIASATEPPVSLLALAELERVSDATCARLLALLDDPFEPHAPLAAAALGRCAGHEARRAEIAAALSAHLAGEDPASDTAHEALLALLVG